MEQVAEQVECAQCGEMIDNTSPDGISCEPCFNEFFPCEQCGDTVHENILTTTVHHGLVCETCMSDYVACSVCNTYHHDNYMSYAEDSGQEYCEHCRDAHLFFCDQCNYYYRNDNGGDDDICQGCNENMGGVRRYDYRPTFQFHKHGTDNVSNHRYYMGVELEVEAQDYDTRQSVASSINKEETYFYAKSDASLTEGFELCGHPSTLNFHLRSGLWRRMIRQLRQDGFTSHNTETCGLHIHLNRGRNSRGIRLGEVHECKIAYFIHTQRHLLRKLGRRDASSYGYFVDNKELKKGSNMNNSRHEAVNFTAHTLEMRFPKGTLNLETLYATLEMIDSIARWCKTYSVARFGRFSEARQAWLAFVQAKPNGYEYLPRYLSTRQVI